MSERASFREGSEARTQAANLILELASLPDSEYSDPVHFSPGTILLPNTIEGAVYAEHFDAAKIDETLDRVDQMLLGLLQGD